MKKSIKKESRIVDGSPKGGFKLLLKDELNGQREVDPFNE